MQAQKLVGYTRVSTDRQADDGLGLDVQEQAIQTWCSQHQFTLLVPIYRDSVSGTLDHGDRPGLSAALARVESGEAVGLIIHKLDRLARSLTVQEAALAHVWNSGGEVYTVERGLEPKDDPHDPMRTAMRQMAGVFAQLEKGMIVARMQSGRRAKAAKGGYAYGSPPYGWRSQDRELVPVASEQEAIRLARKLHAQGVSLRTIAQTLENLGHERRNGSTHWYPIQVARAINAPVKVVADIIPIAPAHEGASDA